MDSFWEAGQVSHLPVAAHDTGAFITSGGYTGLPALSG